MSTKHPPPGGRVGHSLTIIRIRDNNPRLLKSLCQVQFHGRGSKAWDWKLEEWCQAGHGGPQQHQSDADEHHPEHPRAQRREWPLPIQPIQPIQSIPTDSTGAMAGEKTLAGATEPGVHPALVVMPSREPRCRGASTGGHCRPVKSLQIGNDRCGEISVEGGGDGGGARGWP